MHEFKRFVSRLKPPSLAYDSWLEDTARAVEISDTSQLKSRVLTFEQSLGVLLRCDIHRVRLRMRDMHTLLPSPPPPALPQLAVARPAPLAPSLPAARWSTSSRCKRSTFPSWSSTSPRC